MFGKSKLNVTLLYSAPLHIKDTQVLLDGEPLLQFKDHKVEEYPPRIGSKSTNLKNGSHVLEVIDTNFGLKKKESFRLKKQTWVDIIIHDDSISFHFLDKPPAYK